MKLNEWFEIECLKYKDDDGKMRTPFNGRIEKRLRRSWSSFSRTRGFADRSGMWSASMAEFNLTCLTVVIIGTILCFVNDAVRRKTYIVKFIDDKVRNPEIAVKRIVKARSESEAVKKALKKIDKRDRGKYRMFEVVEVRT